MPAEIVGCEEPASLVLRHTQIVAHSRHVFVGCSSISISHTCEIDIWAVVNAMQAKACMPKSRTECFVILQVDDATFTFVDLPGIQQLPLADHEASKAFVASYLTDDSQDTLVLCVVDATTAADLERSAVLKEIIAVGKLSNTILALTK